VLAAEHEDAMRFLADATDGGARATGRPPASAPRDVELAALREGEGDPT
jgi:hypothetical protein